MIIDVMILKEMVGLKYRIYTALSTKGAKIKWISLIVKEKNILNLF